MRKMHWLGILVWILVGCIPIFLQKPAIPVGISLDPLKASRGSPVEVTLSGLQAEDAIVLFAGQRVEAVRASSNKLRFNVPEKATSGTQEVRVISGKQEARNSLFVPGRIVFLATPDQRSKVQDFIKNKSYTIISDFASLGGKEPENPCSNFFSVVDTGLDGEQLQQAIEEAKNVALSVDDGAWWVGSADLSLPDALKSTGIDIAQKKGLSGKGVTVAVLDTGVNNDPSLTPRLLAGYNAIDGTTNVQDSYSNAPAQTRYHGTAVARIANAVAPGANLLPVKTCSDDGLCLIEHMVIGVCQTLNRTDNRQSLVINLSVGGTGKDNANDLLYRILNYAASQGVLIAASGGNGAKGEHYPAAFSLDAPNRKAIPGLVAVAALALDQRHGLRDEWVPFAGGIRGPYIDISAPGVNLLVPLGGIIYRYTGTSFATPVVAGALALLREARASDSPEAIKALLKKNAKPLNFSPEEVGVGMLDLSMAP